MAIRPFLAFVLMLAVMFTSSLSGMAAGSAATMNHDMQMVEMGHCSSSPAKQDASAAAKPCCIAMCMAVAISPPAPDKFVQPEHSISYFAVPASRHGYLGEIATPPPRQA